MPEYKKVVSVKKTGKLYRVFKELELNGESIVDNTGHEWNTAMQQFTKKTNNLQSKNLIEPLWIQRDGMIVKKRLIRVPKDVMVIEEPGNEKSKFRFTRRK